MWFFVTLEEFSYARLLTYSSFSMRLCEALARASCTAFYNIAMLNLLVEIVTTKETPARLEEVGQLMSTQAPDLAVLRLI